jgi:hypothetical protein
MPRQSLPYEQWLDEGLRGVIRRALSYAAEQGLPGQHHFYISFATAAADVEVPPEVRARYPSEMTIVLQHQFWDLVVDEDGFAVTLKFQGRSNRLKVPFTAVTAFGDPSVNFGLQLRTALRQRDADARNAPAEDANTPPAEDGGTAARAAAAGGKAQPAAQVIALDTFRKK